MADDPGLSFAGLLRQLRADVPMTQEELAAAAGLAARSVSDLERGINRTARLDTARLLADALGLTRPVRELFVAAARGRIPAAEVLTARQQVAPGAFAAAAVRSLPRDIAVFTGRQAELSRLLEALAATAATHGVVGIHAIDGMAGVGKTTFAVHAAHQLTGLFPDGQFFVPLHAHTAGQRPVGPADALASLLLTAGVPAAQIPPGLEARAGQWRDAVAGRKILLLLDDAAGHEQVRPLLPGTAGSLVLVTSRRRLAALDDATVISLDTLPPGQAAALLARLAARPAIRAADPAVCELTQLCGHLPLAIGMLASQLRHHPAWTPAGLAAELAAAKDRLGLLHAENLSVAAAFGLSYADLTPGTQRLFRRLGLIPGPDFDAHAAAALHGTGLGQARRHLGELYDQHLVTEPAAGRYQLHDLLREHARALAAGDGSQDRDAATSRLLDYYLHTALAAAQQIPTTNPNLDSLPAARPPESAPALPTPGRAASWLEDERANLHAAADHAAATGLTRHATLIPAALASFLALQGRWDQALTLHRIALDAARRAGDRPGQARALMLLSDMHTMTGDCAAGISAAEQALALFRDLGDQAGQADALNGVGLGQWLTGHYPAAVTCHRQALVLFREAGNRHGQTDALVNLTELYCWTGSYPLARACAEQALHLSRDAGNQYDQADALNLLSMVQRLTGDYPGARAYAEQALLLYRDIGHQAGHATALSELGTLQRLSGDYPAAAASQRRALELSRRIGDRYREGRELNELGLIQQLTEDHPAAADSHQRALRLFRDLDDPYGQAEALNSLGELACRTSDPGQARKHHAEALAIAAQIGAPLQEARALEGTGHSHLRDADPGQAAMYLRQALAVYQHIGAPDAQRARDALRGHGLC